ncbi:hypothetical protein [Alteromonas lipotrueae]|uniref:hypothetical protein n=1 Tax=Alteromonas lipotrueae TaxID=2803814 RepID=UPI001C482496|nr:hypothetical protein [Alteromonas lipotrueae]
MNQADYESVLKEAEAGNSSALYQLGMLKFTGAYIKGVGFIEQQKDEGYKLLKDAATLGNAKALIKIEKIEREDFERSLMDKERSRLEAKSKYLLDHKEPSIIDEIESEYLKKKYQEKQNKESMNLDSNPIETYMKCMMHDFQPSFDGKSKKSILLSDSNERIEKRYQDSDVKLIGYLFCRPTSQKAKNEIISNLNYFHFRSEDSIDIYMMGFYPDKRAKEGFKIASALWAYSDEMFNESRGNMEALTNWRYSGGIDLLLTQVVYDSEKNTYGPDFSMSIVCHIDDLVEIKAFSSIEAFFEKLFRHAEYASSDNPIWELSDQFGMCTIQSGLRRFILSLLPKNLLGELDIITKFAITDIVKR